MENIAGRIRLMICHDLLTFREGLVRLLADHGDIVIVAEAVDGLEAVELAKREQPDVAIVEVALPGLNGFETTRRIKSVSPATSVLILSYHDFESHLLRALNSGAEGYLSKRVSFADLVACVRALHAGGMVLDHVLMRKLIPRLDPKSRTAKHASGELNPRELDVLKLTARGMSNKEIAGALAISPRTVQGHLINIFEKMNVRSRTEAALRGLREGWIDIDDLS